MTKAVVRAGLAALTESKGGYRNGITGNSGTGLCPLPSFEQPV